MAPLCPVEVSLVEEAEDEEDESDEPLEESSPESLPLEERSCGGSSYSTGFMRGPHATTNRRTPTKESAWRKMLERFTGMLLDDRLPRTTVRYRGRSPHRKCFPRQLRNSEGRPVGPSSLLAAQTERFGSFAIPDQGGRARDLWVGGRSEDLASLQRGGTSSALFGD